MRSLTFTIPGAPVGPNQRPSTTRARMALVKRERDKAYLVAKDAANRTGTLPFTGPAVIRFEVRRHRLLDELVNLPASLKHYQDGICKAMLPVGDGPQTPYRWLPPVQIRVWAEHEGVFVEIVGD